MKVIEDEKSAARKSSPSPNEAIAIIGMSCRFPQAPTLEAFWDLLYSGKDTVREIPRERWNADDYYDRDPKARHKTNQRHASMLENIHDFDSLFFSISPAEATEMSPSQKLMLELVWEVIEDSKIPFRNALNKKTGVYVGNIWNDFEHHRKHKNAVVTSHSAVGQSSNIIANRISYTFGFTGPSLVVDTGCSSSLVALHLACQSLLDNSSEMAIAAGVNHILDPDQYILLSKFGGLSSTGKCSTFDANADGFVRGEGGGVVFLKRLSDAERDGDMIHALIRGSAINNNGYNVSLPATSVTGQKLMLADAYKFSGIAPHEVHYVEAHGTGTKLGDPTEARALGEFFSEGRKDNLHIGSVKTNIGHLEAAAGIAGLIKVVLALHKKKLPKSLNYNTPNPAIPFNDLKLAVQNETGDWPAKDNETLKAGINSFGWGGTNAHVVIEEYIPGSHSIQHRHHHTGRLCLPLSAKSSSALMDYAKAYRKLLLSRTESSFQDIVIASAILKPALDVRLLLSANKKEEMIRALDDFIQEPSDVNSNHSTPDNKIVMVFPGQGSQWLGMGKELFDREPVFRVMIRECDETFKSYTDWSLIEQLFSTPADSLLEQINVIQPMLFAIQISLAKLWMSWGIKPHAVVGHSMGEVGAAFISGALSLDDAAKIICTRSKLMRTVSGTGGAMATTGLSLDNAQRLTRRYPRLSIAANNSPQSTVLAGDQHEITEVLIELESQDVFCRLVKVDVASHSHHMDRLKEDLRHALHSVKTASNNIPLYSTVRGNIIQAGALSADYWVSNLRGTVQFSSVVDKLLQDGHTTFIEVSPHPILANAINECAQHRSIAAHVITSTYRDKPEQEAIYKSLGEFYSSGHDIDWELFYGTHKAPKVDLPPYPFQRKRYELESASNSLLQRPNARLIGNATYVADSETCFWETTISLSDFPYLRDHRVNDAIVLPGALYVEMALEAAHELFKTGIPVISRLVFLKSLTLTEEDAVTIQLKLQQQPKQNIIQFFLKTIEHDGKPTWQLMAKGELKIDRSHRGNSMPNSEASESLTKPGASFYQSLTSLGLNYGPYFQNVNQVIASLPNAESIRVNLFANDFIRLSSSKYNIHPALLDSILQPLFYNLVNQEARQDQYTTFLTDIGELYFLKAINHAEELHSVVKLVHRRKDERRGLTVTEADIDIYNSNEVLVLKIRGLRGKVIDTGFVEKRNEKLKDWLYSIQWVRSDRSLSECQTSTSHWVIFGDPYGVSGILVERMKMAGISCIHIVPGLAFSKVSTTEYTIRYGNSDDYNKLIHDLFVNSDEETTGILHAGSMSYTWQDPFLTADRVEEQQVYGSISFMYLHQQLEKLKLQKYPRLVILTNGIHAVGHGHDIAQPVHSPLWGMVKVMFNELTQYQCRYFDLSASPLIEELDQIVDEIQVSNPQENEIALRGDEQFVPRLGVPVVSDALTSQRKQFSSDGTYIVTGFRGLGFVFIEWMIRQGARNFALISRTGDVGTDALERMSVLESQGCRFSKFNADTGNYSELRDTLELIELTMTEIRGVVHAAGVIEARRLVDLNPEEFLRILNPKVKGAWNLHLLTQNKSLDCFIMFSSASTLIGLSGQGSYVAANAFLDTLAHSRKQMGLPGMSVNWGVIKDVGMVANKSELERYARAEGFEPVTMRDAMEVFNLIYDAQYTQIGIVKLNPESMASYYSGLAQTRYFNGLLHKEKNAAKQQSTFPDLFATLQTHEERLVALEQLVIKHTAEVAKTPASHIKAGMTFQKLGFDSLMAVQLWNQLERSTGLKLPLSVFWKHPVIQGCVTFMCSLLEEKVFNRETKILREDNKDERLTGSEWFVIPRSSPTAPYRIFCFHDAGGNTSLYHKWKNKLDDFEIVLVELPGRFKRSEEKPYTELSSLIGDLIPALVPMLDKPFYFFGHSMGGLLAFELTRELRNTNNPMPSKIFISSTPALTTYSKREVDHTMSTESLAEFFPHLSKENVTDDTLRNTLTDLLRKDLLLINNYEYTEQEPLPVDIVVIHGRDDERVSPQQAEQWQAETLSGIKIIARPGGHRYLEHDTDFLTTLINEETESMKTTHEYERVS